MQQRILSNANLDPLSMDALRKYCPAIFANEPHADVSARYGFIPTYKVLEGMQEAGFVPVEVRNYQRRAKARLVHTKHMLKFRPAGNLARLKKVGDTVPQIVMLNSHDRSCNYHLYGGLFRLVCSNGLIVSEGQQVQPVRVRHTKNVVEEVVAQSHEIIKHFKQVFTYVDAMRSTKLTPAQQLAFANAALATRPQRGGIIDASGLLVPQRPEDEGDSLWCVYNRVQEHMTKGGMAGVTATGRRVRTFGMTSINADMALNTGMWALAMQAIAKASASSKRALRKQPEKA